MIQQSQRFQAGQRFVRGLIAATLFLFAFYFALHRYVDDSFGYTSTEGTFRITPFGEVVLLDPETIIWVVGEEKATPILNRMEVQTEQIRTQMERLRKVREILRQRWKAVMGDEVNLAVSPAQAIDQALADGRWQAALTDFAETADQYRNSKVEELVAVMDQAADVLRELARIKREQHNDAQALNPPKIKAIFWTSPHGSIIEVLLFAVFGVLTNLLVSSAEYLRMGKFKESERWVAYTKLVYGPVLAVMLVIAIIMGWFDIGDYKTRAYSLPLLGFIFGFASRKTLALFDSLVARIMGSAEESIERGPAEIARKRAELLDQFKGMMTPRTLLEFREQARNLAEEYVKTEVIKRESAK